MSTRRDVAAKLANQFNNSVYYDEQAVMDSIQDGMDEVAAVSGCVYKSAAIPFTQYTTYYDLLTLLPDYIGVVAVWNNVIRRWMFPTSLKKLNQIRLDWDVQFGTPYYFCPISHRYMAIWLKPGVANYGMMYVYYIAAAPQLADETEIPIPDEHVTALELYSVTDLWEQAQEWGKAADSLNDYINNLENLRVLMKNKRFKDRTPGLK